MLQSIGMTTKQLRRMLMTEGLYYTAAAGFLSLALGGILSLVIADGLLSNLWFFTYTFTLLPLLLVIPLLLFIGASGHRAAVRQKAEHRRPAERGRIER